MSGGELQTKVLYEIGAECLLIGDLADRLGMTRKQVSDAASGLVQKGLAERREIGCFALSEDGKTLVAVGEKITSGPNGAHSVDRKPRRSGTLRQRAWNVMRIKGKFSVLDLMVAATHGDERVAANSLQRFCRQLVRAGVLAQLSAKERGSALNSTGFNRFLLVQDLGMTAPSYRHARQTLFDHNAQKELPLVK